MISLKDASTCSGALLPHFDLGSPARTQVNPSCLSGLVQAFQLLGLQPLDVSTDILILLHSAPLHADVQLGISIQSILPMKVPLYLLGNTACRNCRKPCKLQPPM